MIYVEINNVLHPARIEAKSVDREWGGRASKTIALEMPYDEAVDTFVDNVPWRTVNVLGSYVDEDGKTVTPEPTAYDCSEYCIAGPITDRRDGTVVVKMGKPTQVESQQNTINGLQEQLANAVSEEELEAAYVEGVNSL